MTLYLLEELDNTLNAQVVDKTLNGICLMKYGLKMLVLLCGIILFHNCSSTSRVFEKQVSSAFYKEHFTGIMVYNPVTKDTLVEYNSEKYFIPASNTKIITLYTALKSLPDRIPAFRFKYSGDTLVMKGMGDPTFLHPYFNDSTAYDLAQESKYVKIVSNNFQDSKLGPGWAWEDYDAYFNVERSSFPMYGNVVTISNKDSLQVVPSIFKDSIVLSKKSRGRDFLKNRFYYRSKDTNSVEVPMLLDSTLLLSLWKDVLPQKTVSIVNDEDYSFIMMAHSKESDSVYKRMMLESDNFLAEQLLILSAASRFDTLQTSKIRNAILSNELSQLRHKPRWVDGSGLSRYNLFTPDSFVYILNELYTEIPRDRLFNLFPVGGVSGTLKSRYAGISQPYIYAKSGTVGNNYSLSGYVLTNKGNTLIFSIMNNHYLKPTSDIRDEVERLLEFMRDHY